MSICSEFFGCIGLLYLKLKVPDNISVQIAMILYQQRSNARIDIRNKQTK